MQSTSLGRMLLLAISLFWLPRLVEQIIFFHENSRLSLVFTFTFWWAARFMHLCCGLLFCIVLCYDLW